MSRPRSYRAHAALPLVGAISTPEEAMRAGAALAAQIRQLSGRERLACAAELEELRRAIEEWLETLEERLSELGGEIDQSQRSAKVCIAYARATRPRS